MRGVQRKTQVRQSLTQSASHRLRLHRGEIYDVDGNFVGEHEGIELFTIGQRKGLPGGSARPRYVVDLDPETNRVIVGDVDDLVCDEFEIDRVNWIDPAAANEDVDVTVKIRYSHPGTKAALASLEHNRSQGKVESADEVLAIFKLGAQRYREFETKLRALHPYDVPEIISYKIDNGLPEYLRWVTESCAT